MERNSGRLLTREAQKHEGRGPSSRLRAFAVGSAVLCACFLLALSFDPRADAQIVPYCNVTGVAVEQLNNAVRVKLEADGALAPNINKWWSGGQQADYYLNWELVSQQTGSSWDPVCYPRVDRILLHLDNALSQAGSVINIGKYPVSHVRLEMAPDSNAHYGLDVEVVLQRPMRIRTYQFGQRGMWDAYLWDHHDPAWFEMVLSPDKRSLIFTVASDRLPERRGHRRVSEAPEKDRQLTVHFDAGRLSLHARNVALGEVTDAVSRETGLQFAASGAAADRLITAELPAAGPEEFAARVADCYGLMLTGTPGHRVFSDAVGESAASQAAITETRIPLHHLQASVAAGLLPNFLTDFVRIDSGSNALLVAGPPSLADKVAADLAKLDEPAPNIVVRARVIETESSDDLASAWVLSGPSADQQVSTDTGVGQITYSTLGVPPEVFEGRLDALHAAGRVRLRADTSVVVVNGQAGVLFAGQSKNVVLFRAYWDTSPSVVPVAAGVKITVTPWAGADRVSMQVATEVGSIDAVDPASGLPVVSTRTAQGAFCLRSGETAALGGLTQTEESWERRKLPMLGDLPLIGGLFRWKRRSRASSELVVLLTPGFVDAKPTPPAVGDGQTRGVMGQGPGSRSGVPTADAGTETRSLTPDARVRRTP